jgi:hypothetical protein
MYYLCKEVVLSIGIILMAYLICLMPMMYLFIPEYHLLLIIGIVGILILGSHFLRKRVRLPLVVKWGLGIILVMVGSLGVVGLVSQCSNPTSGWISGIISSVFFYERLVLNLFTS